MPASFCLLPKYADELKAKFASGELDVRELAAMSSAERRGAFASIVGESSAEHVNASFESRLLLKHQNEALTRWVKSVSDVKPEVKRDLLSRVQRLDRVLEPKERAAFLEDLAKQKLGFGVTMEEAAKISELAKSVQEAKAALATGGDRMDYGRAKVAFSNYVGDLQNGVKKPLTVGKIATDTFGFSKSIKAAFDNSALFRQGWKNLFAHPEIWAKNALQSFTDIAREWGGAHVMDEVNADIVSRPNAVNGNYAKAKLALGNIEEAYPSTLPEKIPILKRAYKASEAAFTAFQYRSRADVFDKYIEIAQKSGVDLSEPRQLESIGKLVNSLTARGDLAKLEPAADVTNVAFFSARKLKSDIDFLTAHQFQQDVTPFVRKQAAINLLKVASGTAAILVIADAVSPGSVEWDPRSSDFGKIKIGSTRVDVTGGMGSILTLGARLATMSSKSTTGGKVVGLNSGRFGAQTGKDVVYNFFENKLSPAASVVKELLAGRTFDGEKPTLANELKNFVEPLPLNTLEDLLKTPDGAPVLLGMIFDGLGLSVSTRTPRKTVRH